MRKYRVLILIILAIFFAFPMTNLKGNIENNPHPSPAIPDPIIFTPLNTTTSIELYTSCILGWNVYSDSDTWITYQIKLNASIVYSHYEHFILGTTTILYDFTNDIANLENLTITSYDFKLEVLTYSHTYTINITNQAPQVTATTKGTFEASPNENTASYIQWTATDPNVSYQDNLPYHYCANYSVVDISSTLLKNGTWNSSIPIKFYPFMNEYKTYNFTIILNDGFGNSTSHTVNVTTVNLAPRFSKTQTNTIVEYNGSLTASWIVNDPSAFDTRTYTIYDGNEVLQTGEWTHLESISYEFTNVVKNSTIIISVFDGVYTTNSSFIITTTAPASLTPEEPNTWIIVGGTVGGIGAAGVGGFYGYRFLQKRKCLPPNEWKNGVCVPK